MQIFVIGITGGSASGKSSLATMLADRLGNSGGATVLAMDHYYHDSEHLVPEADGHINFDRLDAIDTDLFAQHLNQLKSGQAILRPEYDFATHRRLADREVRVAPQRFVIAEGLLLLALEGIRNLLDLKVFVDAAEADRRSRRLARDTDKAGSRQRTHDDVLRQWNSTVEPFYQQVILPSKFEADCVLSDGDLESHESHVFELIDRFARA